MNQLTGVLTHPQNVIFAIAAILLYPVLVIEILSVAWVVFQAGYASMEAFRRRRPATTVQIDATFSAMGAGASVRDRLLGVAGLRLTPMVLPVVLRLAEMKDLDRLGAMRAVDDLEFDLKRRLERTRVFIRIGPILGLMGTLIPISPALVAMAEGNTQVLANSLRVAFSTTVVGLLIGGLGYLVSSVRDRWYNRDIKDLEYILDRQELS